jgi:hypothetical protein
MTASKVASGTSIASWSHSRMVICPIAAPRRAAASSIAGATSASTTRPDSPVRAAAAIPAPPGPAARSSTASPGPICVASSIASVACAMWASTRSALRSQALATLFQISDMTTASQTGRGRRTASAHAGWSST